MDRFLTEAEANLIADAVTSHLARDRRAEVQAIVQAVVDELERRAARATWEIKFDNASPGPGWEPFASGAAGGIVWRKQVR